AIVNAVALAPQRSAHEREADATSILEDDEGMGTVVGEPARHQFGFAIAILAARGEHPRVHARLRQIVQILEIPPLDPVPVLRRVLRIAYGDCHEISPAETPLRGGV